VNPRTLDHVALWVEGRDRIADFLTAHVGMHVIDRTDRFTLVGADARRGKLTLFDADGPRERGALEHVALRVSDLERAASELPEDLDRIENDGELYFDLFEGLRLGLVEAPTASEYDLDHVALRASDAARAATEYQALGFEEAEPGRSGHPRVTVGGAYIELWPGGQGEEPEQPLLNHLAVLVDSADDELASAEELGLEVADVVDAANTYAVFVWGPERVKIEYVEHKPSFSLT
jgi:catechol 2,3-dioxygenase-like lactoylglutathione lyase family enzyme